MTITTPAAETEEDEWMTICTCGSWPKMSTGPSNIAHSDDCGLMMDDDEDPADPVAAGSVAADGSQV